MAGAAGVETRLADAAMKRDVAAVRALIAQKVDVNAPGTDGSPALHWAVRVDDAAMAKLLLGAGAQATLANRYGLTPMAIAAANGSASMIAILLDAGADANAPDPLATRPLMSAARSTCGRRHADCSLAAPKWTATIPPINRPR